MLDREQAAFQLAAHFAAEAAPLIDGGMAPHDAYVALADTTYVPDDFAARVAERIAILRGVTAVDRAAQEQKALGLEVPHTPEGLA